MISKYRFKERLYNNEEDPCSIVVGTIEIHHNLSDEELEEALAENGLFLDDVDGISYFDIEYPNAFSDFSIEKIN